MNNIVLRTLLGVINGKGGIGKTYVTTLVAQWLAFRSLCYTVLDYDDNQSLCRLLPGTQRHNLKPADGVESLLSKIIESEVTLADFPANITAEVTNLFATTEFKPSLESINGRLIILLVVVANDAVALDEARRLVAAIKDTATYIVVKNERNGSDFTDFDVSPIAQYLKTIGSETIRIPQLIPKLQAPLDSDRLTLAQFIGRFWELRETDPKAAFRQTVPAQSATTSLRFVFSQLDAIASKILPTALATKITTNDLPVSITNLGQTAWQAKKQAIQQKAAQ